MASLASGSPASPATARSDERLPAVDGLRGVAILLVMLSHFVSEPGSTAWLDRAFWRVASLGWCGVDLFFVLSGFLITGILLDGAEAGSPRRNFYARRALRVVPAYYALLALVLVVHPVFFPWDRAAHALLAREQGWYWAFASNVLVTPPGAWERALQWTLHLWSLAVEEQFYLVWPILIWTAGRRRAAAVCWTAIAVSVVGRAWWWVAMHHPVGSYVLTPLRLDGLAAGALVAIARRREAEGTSRGPWRAIAVAALSFGVVAAIARVAAAPQNFNPLMQVVGFPALAAGFASLLALTLRYGATHARWLAARPLRAAGRYSYAGYLFHYPVYFALTSLGAVDDLLPRIAGSQLPGMLFLAVLSTAISFAIAAASWHLLERRVLALKRFVPYGPARAAVGEATSAGAPPRARAA